MEIRFVSLMKYQIVILLVIEALISILHLPGIIRYVLDANMLFLIASFLPQLKMERLSSQRHIETYLYAYIGALTLFAFLRLVPVGQVLWAVRNNFFYLFFFIMCIAKFTIDDADEIMELILKFQSFNLLCGLYEFFVMHLSNDFLGGMFGCEQGCNGYSNIYLVIICTYVITLYMQGKCLLPKVIWIAGGSILLATLAELKIFYFELVLIVLFEVLLNKKNKKAVIVVLGGMAAIMIGIQILSTTSSESLSYLRSVDALLEYGARSDFGNGDIRISRMTALAQINEYFFEDNMWLKLFGYGLGACEDSASFAWCHSEFATKYGYLQYRNISSSMLYLETGIVGLFATMLIFVLVFIYSTKSKDKLAAYGYEHISVFGQVMSIQSILSIWYNSAIRREISYLLFFSLSLIFIYMRTISQFMDEENVN